MTESTLERILKSLSYLTDQKEMTRDFFVGEKRIAAATFNMESGLQVVFYNNETITKKYTDIDVAAIDIFIAITDSD
ncbi:hypothetical protein [Halobacillus sp. A5]|uniref:hypothetical protein n=1 Tax=Halobacillus sp. A5 TaxID=2880263 RepID=UPI0020A65E0C|nr:hypothetical protein [Halobacillus sp. A5]MCP3029638.1 hypothetical protein [Halobacillus sp. A5]